MIKHYTDHSANERTYLAWIRTSIAIMAFGFLIEKFDIFVSYIGKAIGNEEHFQSSLSAEIVGLGLFLVGVLIVITDLVNYNTGWQVFVNNITKLHKTWTFRYINQY